MVFEQSWCEKGYPLTLAWNWVFCLQGNIFFGTKTTDQYSPVRLEQARLVSNVFMWHTVEVANFEFPAFENEKDVAYENGPNGNQEKPSQNARIYLKTTSAYNNTAYRPRPLGWVWSPGFLAFDRVIINSFQWLKLPFYPGVLLYMGYIRMCGPKV